MNRIFTPVGGLDKNFLCKTEYFDYEIVLVPCQNEEKRKLRNKFRWGLMGREEQSTDNVANTDPTVERKL